MGQVEPCPWESLCVFPYLLHFSVHVFNRMNPCAGPGGLLMISGRRVMAVRLGALLSVTPYLAEPS